jgi:hypothetical protein
MIDHLTTMAARQQLAAQQARAEQLGPSVPASPAQSRAATGRQRRVRVPQAGAHPGFRLFGSWATSRASR